MIEKILYYSAQVIGIAAIAIFLLSYQQKERKRIIVLNAASRVLYIIQYLLLGAFEGAVLDILGAISSVIATKKDTPFLKKHLKLAVVGIDLVIVGIGLTLYQSPLSLLPIAGILFHTTAFWISDERIIRWVSLLGSPCWFVYNFASQAYGSSVGDLLSIASIVIAMIKYRNVKTQTSQETPVKETKSRRSLSRRKNV